MFCFSDLCMAILILIFFANWQKNASKPWIFHVIYQARIDLHHLPQIPGSKCTIAGTFCCCFITPTMYILDIAFYVWCCPWSFQATITLWQFSSWFFVTNNWSNNMKTAQQENQTRLLLLIKSGNIKFHYHSWQTNNRIPRAAASRTWLLFANYLSYHYYHLPGENNCTDNTFQLRPKLELQNVQTSLDLIMKVVLQWRVECWHTGR
jgi:hypothetical protein